MKSKNNIEESFREKFDSGSMQNEGWNEPRSIVWKKIEKDLFKKEKKKFSYLHFLLMSVLGLTLTFTYYLYSQNQELKDVIQESSTNKMSNLDRNVPKESTLAIAPNENEKTIIENKVQEEKISAPIVLEKKIKKESNLKGDSKQSIFDNSIKKNNNILFGEGGVIPPVKVESGVGLDDNKRDNAAIINNENVIKENGQSVARQVSKFSSLKGIKNHLVFDRIIASPKMVVIKNEEESRRPYISFLPNIATGILQSNGLQQTSLSELIDKEYGNTGFGFDFLYSVPIHKSIDFSVGLGVESISFSTEYDITLPYMTEDETIVGAEGFIDFEHSLPTAFGNTDTTLRLSRKRASDILNESNVDLDFNTQHNFVMLSLPIGVKYRLGNEKSFFNLGIITRPTYILDANSSIQSVTSHHSAIDAINNESFSTYSNVRKLNVSLGFEVGYNLFLTEKSGLNINLSLNDYLFDFYEINDFSSSVQRAGVSIGYTYTL